MSFLAGIFLQTFYVRRFTGHDQYDQPSYGAAEAYPCRYQPSTRLLRDRDGGQSVTEAVLYTSATGLSVRDTIYPPGADPADVNQGRLPIRVDAHYDLESGALDHAAVHI